jgi:uroporphyrinogen decarboxylase
MVQEDPQGLTRLIDCIADATIEYLNSQIEAGVDAIQIFESWAMHLSGRDYQTYVVAPLQKILSNIKPCPTIIFARGNVEPLFALKASALSLDWQQDLQASRKKYPTTCLQGNFNPDLLLTDPETIQKSASSLLDAMQGDPAYIFNLGHGVHKDTPRHNVEALVSCIKSRLP